MLLSCCWLMYTGEEKLTFFFAHLTNMWMEGLLQFLALILRLFQWNVWPTLILTMQIKFISLPFKGESLQADLVRC